jgi:hypothetical protein
MRLSDAAWYSQDVKLVCEETRNRVIFWGFPGARFVLIGLLILFQSFSERWGEDRGGLLVIFVALRFYSM